MPDDLPDPKTSLSKEFIVSFYPNLYDHYESTIEQDKFMQYMRNHNDDTYNNTHSDANDHVNDNTNDNDNGNDGNDDTNDDDNVQDDLDNNVKDDLSKDSSYKDDDEESVLSDDTIKPKKENVCSHR
jgi:hypothetical protein